MFSWEKCAFFWLRLDDACRAEAHNPRGDESNQKVGSASNGPTLPFKVEYTRVLIRPRHDDWFMQDIVSKQLSDDKKYYRHFNTIFFYTESCELAV